MDKQELYDIFSIFGNVIACNIGKIKETNRGYVCYHETEKCANKAVVGVYGMSINNMVVQAGHFVPHGQQRDCRVTRKVFVKNIPRSYADEDSCSKIFCGMIDFYINPGYRDSNVVFSKIWHKDYGNEGIFEFETHEQANAAVRLLNGHRFSSEHKEGLVAYLTTNINTIPHGYEFEITVNC